MYCNTSQASRNTARIRRAVSVIAATTAVLANSSLLHAQAPVIRDSAGVRIVENPSRLKAPVTFTLGSKPVFEVGGLEDDPNVEFNHNQGYLRGVRLASGGLAVIDVVRVHYFDAEGKRLRTVGRKGQGPEEMLYATAICRTRGDTIVVGDSHNRRITVVDGAGEIVRTAPYAVHGSPMFDACLDDGTLLLTQPQRDAAGNSTLTRIQRMRTDGTLANVVGDIATRPFDFVTQSQPVVVAAGNRIVVGEGIASEIRIMDPSGKLLSIVRSNDPPIAISAADVERRLASTIPNNVSAAERAQRMDRMRARPHASTWPPYGQIHVDPDQRIWVQDYRSSYPSTNNWTAFDASGRLLGRLILPAAPAGQLQPLVIGFGRNELLVRRIDSDGSSYLTVYPILRVDQRGR